MSSTDSRYALICVRMQHLTRLGMAKAAGSTCKLRLMKY